MALEGDIKDFGLPDILEFIANNKKSGVLTFVGEEDTASIGFENGDIVAASYSRKGNHEQLGRYLIQSGRLSPERLNQLERLARETKTPLQEIILQDGCLSTENLKEIICYKIQEILDELFKWKEGKYKFETDAVLYPSSKLKIVVKTNALLLEGMRRLDEWPRIEKTLPDPLLILRRTSQPFLEAELSEEESKILSFIDGKRTIGELIEITGLGKFRTFHTLYNMMELGLLEKIGKKSPKKERKIPLSALTRKTLVTIETLILSLAILLTNIGIGIVVGKGMKKKEIQLNERPFEFYLLNQKLENIKYGLEVYYLSKGKYPQDLNTLVRNGILNRTQIFDPWGRAFLYRSSKEGYLYYLSFLPP